MGVIMIVMCVMMMFGGMHMKHGGHRSEGDHPRMEQKHDHDENGTQHMHNHAGGQDSIPGQDETK
jgi:hypothetical protein